MQGKVGAPQGGARVAELQGAESGSARDRQRKAEVDAVQAATDMKIEYEQRIKQGKAE